MGSAVNGLGSFDPSTLINSLSAAAPSATPAAQSATPAAEPATSAAQTATPAALTNGVSAKQELSAMQKSGELDHLLSDSIAVGVLQFADPSSMSSTAGTDLSTLVNQLISEYTTPVGSPATSTSSSSGSTVPQSAAALSTNPALAIIQAMEGMGILGSAIADSLGADTIGQATTA